MESRIKFWHIFNARHRFILHSAVSQLRNLIWLPAGILRRMRNFYDSARFQRVPQTSCQCTLWFWASPWRWPCIPEPV